MSGDAIAFCAVNRYPRGRIIRTAGTCMDSGGPGLVDRLRGALRRLRGSARRLRHDRAFLFKATSFAGVGVVNTLVDFGVFSFAFLVVGLPIVIANICSWAVAVTGSYVMNSLITFRIESQRGLRLKSYIGFVVSQIAGLVANTATVVAAALFMEVLKAKVLAIAVSFVVNFSLSHFFVFRPLGPKPDGTP
jgi:putative flippase GtrA